MRRTLVGLVALLAVTAPAQAQGLRGFLRMGGDFGGDPVLQFEYSDGSSPDVAAGRGLALSAGGVLQLPISLEVVVSAGLKYTSVPPAANQDASWMRYPVEGLLLYRAPFGLRVGGGATVHFGNVMEASGEVANTRLEFATKPGFIVQAQWGRGRWALDLRYTAMEYEIESGGTGTVNASSFGGGFSFFFGGH